MLLFSQFRFSLLILSTSIIYLREGCGFYIRNIKMQIRLNRFFLDEKDLFVALFGVFLVIAWLIQLPVSPFRFSSLVTVFIFLVFTRSLISQLKFTSYLYIALSGLLFSMILSPYGLVIYLVIAVFLYTKTNLI